jgi:hypothetical protein
MATQTDNNNLLSVPALTLFLYFLLHPNCDLSVP